MAPRWILVCSRHQHSYHEQPDRTDERGLGPPGRGPCGSIVVSSIRGDLRLKTTDGWKFIDATAGRHAISWDSANAVIANSTGIDQGLPKQLFHLALDLGEDNNLISSLGNNTDSLPKSYELLHGLDPNSPRDAFTDLDGDGANNSEEFIAGADPADSVDVFRITRFENSATGITLTWPSVLGRTHTIEWSTDSH